MREIKIQKVRIVNLDWIVFLFGILFGFMIGSTGVCHASTYSTNYNVIGGSSGGASRVNYQEITTQSGTSSLTDIFVYTSGTVDLNCALYSDGGGFPLTLLATSTNHITDSSASWKDCSFTPYSLASTVTNYYIAYLDLTQSATFQSDATSTSPHFYDSNYMLTDFPTVVVTPTNYPNIEFSMYASIDSGGGGGGGSGTVIDGSATTTNLILDSLNRTVSFAFLAFFFLSVIISLVIFFIKF